MTGPILYYQRVQKLKQDAFTSLEAEVTLNASVLHFSTLPLDRRGPRIRDTRDTIS